jgi:hypothetical protein
MGDPRGEKNTATGIWHNALSERKPLGGGERKNASPGTTQQKK